MFAVASIITQEMILPGCELPAPTSNLVRQNNLIELMAWKKEACQRNLRIKIIYLFIENLLILFVWTSLFLLLLFFSIWTHTTTIVFTARGKEKSIVMEWLKSSITHSDFYTHVFVIPKSMGKTKMVDFRNHIKIYRSHWSSQKTPQITYIKPENCSFGWMWGPQ